MAKKWTNRNLPGAMHLVTANCNKRVPVFKNEHYCSVILDCLGDLRESHPFKLIAYVLMPDHCHLIINPREGRITDLTGAIKGISARRIIDASPSGAFLLDKPAPDGANRQVWQDSFKAFPLWSDWMIWQKINYIHNNPINAGHVKSAAEYHWSSFRGFYFQSGEPLVVDRDWWWPEDVKKLSRAAAEWSKEISRDSRVGKRDSQVSEDWRGQVPLPNLSMFRAGKSTEWA